MELKELAGHTGATLAVAEVLEAVYLVIHQLRFLPELIIEEVPELLHRR